MVRVVRDVILALGLKRIHGVTVVKRRNPMGQLAHEDGGVGVPIDQMPFDGAGEREDCDEAEGFAAGVFEAIQDDGVNSVLIEKLARVAAGDVVNDIREIVKDMVAEGAAIDEDLLLRPEAPHEEAAIDVGVQHGRRDVVILEELGGSPGELPLGGAELEALALRDGGTDADEEETAGGEFGDGGQDALPGEICRDEERRDDGEDHDVADGPDGGGGEAEEEYP